MPSIESISAAVARHPYMMAGTGLGVAGAAYGYRKGKSESSDPGYAFMRSGGMAMAGVAAGGLATAAFQQRKALSKTVQALGAGVAAGSGRYIKDIARDVSAQKSWTGKVLGRGSVAIAGGALVGSLVTGYNEDDPGKGALVGAAVGAAAYAANKGRRVWNAASKIPGGKSALILAGGAAIAIGGRAMAPDEEPSMEGVATRDAGGGYETNTVHDRMNTINATGDLVFGLHNRR
jgi:hypothetical protein